MKKQDFINIYKELSTEVKRQIDEKLDDARDCQDQLTNLTEKLEKLSPQERNDLEKDETEFMKQSDEELQDIKSTYFPGQDAESREEDRAIEIINHENETKERFISEYPMGIKILENYIYEIYQEIYRLIPIK